MTCVSNELHNVVSSNVVCQTAKIGDNDQVGYIGTLLPCFISADRTLELEMSLPNTVELPHYRRRSLSIHALKRLGYEVDHRLRRHGNLLWLKLPNGKEYSFKLLTFDDADYLIVRLHKPALTITTSAINLVNTMKPEGLYHLIHLRMGCPGRRAMELLLNGKSVIGLPPNVPIPTNFSCPICLKEKQPSLPKNHTKESPFKVVGQLLHMDFCFYGKQSCCGFKCFLVVTETLSNHR